MIGAIKKPLDGFKNDVWSAGVTLLTLTIGQPLWNNGASRAAVWLATETDVNKRAKWIKGAAPKLSDAFTKWLARHFFAPQGARSHASVIMKEIDTKKMPPIFGDGKGKRDMDAIEMEDMVSTEHDSDMTRGKTVCINIHSIAGSDGTNGASGSEDW
jgi:hypothetical protein